LQTIAGTFVSLKTITIKDIASELNLSALTVSRVLSDHPDIHKKIKKLVNKGDDELEYFFYTCKRFQIIVYN